MAIALVSLSIKHERRIRAVFSNTLAAGAFTDPSLYVLTCTNSAGADPGVQKAVAILSSPNVVELQLDLDLVGGGVYRLQADGVPAVDLSVTPADSFAFAKIGRASCRERV